MTKAEARPHGPWMVHFAAGLLIFVLLGSAIYTLPYVPFSGMARGYAFATAVSIAVYLAWAGGILQSLPGRIARGAFKGFGVVATYLKHAHTHKGGDTDG